VGEVAGEEVDEVAGEGVGAESLRAVDRIQFL
jgi:hypothetical protein